MKNQWCRKLDIFQVTHCDLLRSHAFKEKSMRILPITSKKQVLFSAKISRAALVHWNFRAGSTFPVPHAVCTVSPGHWANKEDNHQD